ncbi:hypothetical protein V6N13_040047 [Hibiscus sabdariffa]
MNFKLLFWNAQGCGHPKFITSAREYLRDSRPDVVAFVEPRISGWKADRVISALAFPYSHRVEAVGFSGGIWLAWYETVKIDILQNHFQYIYCRISSTRDNRSTLTTLVYASPNSQKRKALWLELNKLAYSIRSPWFIVGDFNATHSDSDRRGCAASTKPSKAFQELVFDHGLRDIGFSGPDYTWSCGLAHVRLDRVFCNSYWDKTFPDSTIQYLLRMKSDHRPIMLIVGDVIRFNWPKQFRYFSGWLSHDDFSRMVQDNWIPSANIVDTIKDFTKAAMVWNETVFGYIDNRIVFVLFSFTLGIGSPMTRF